MLNIDGALRPVTNFWSRKLILALSKALRAIYQLAIKACFLMAIKA